MVCTTNTPGDNAICRKNPDYTPGIYTTKFTNDEFHIVAENQRNQDKKKMQHKYIHKKRLMVPPSK